MTTVGIIGCGFVGGALKDWLEKNNKDVKVVVSDRKKKSPAKKTAVRKTSKKAE